MSRTTSTITTGTAGRPRALREVVLMVGLFLLYRQVRYLTRNDTAAATANARRVVGFERHLGIFSESALQRLVMHSHTVVEFLNRYYVMVHFPLTTAFVVWVLVRHAAWYRPIRQWFVVVTGAALAIHVAYPLAPPRMLAGEGFVDTLREFGPQIYSTDTTHSVANQFAAMPSLHFGWALMVALGFVAIRRSRLSLLAFIHPLITLLAIVATANHYWIDAVVAFVLVAGSAAVITSRHRRNQSERDRQAAISMIVLDTRTTNTGVHHDAHPITSTIRDGSFRPRPHGDPRLDVPCSGARRRVGVQRQPRPHRHQPRPLDDQLAAHVDR